MRLPIAALAAALLVTGCGAKPGATVTGAWVRLPAVAGRPGAAYFTLTAGKQPLVLLKATTPAAVRAELHESMTMAGGMMSMKPSAQVAVPAGGTVSFVPGGRHVMLFDVNPALKSGGTATLTLAFADGSAITAPAVVRGAGDPAP